jgi:hypothetical protein
MKPLCTIIIVLILAVNLRAQNRADSISTTFSKFVVLNDKKQVLLVYSSYYKAWELPGTAYEGPITFNNLLDTCANYFGIKYKDAKLGGLFTYFKPSRYRATIKPYFVMRFIGYAHGNQFSDTANTKWFDVEKAKKIIPYPTMVLILDQLLKYKGDVWGAAFEEYNYDPPSGTKWRIIEPFYKLN